MHNTNSANYKGAHAKFSTRIKLTQMFNPKNHY